MRMTNDFIAQQEKTNNIRKQILACSTAITATATFAAMTTPVGGYAPGTNDVPGMQGGRDPATNGGHRNTAFLDAGACSKMMRALPSATSFFRNVRKAVSGLQTQSASNASAIKNLLHAQANLNDQTNQLNYWMRQISPQVDKLTSELVASNDALAALPGISANNVDAPGMPDSVTLVPGTSINSLMLYFTRPSYTGASAVTGYEMVTFTSANDALLFSNASAAVDLSEATLAAALVAPWTTANADEFYGAYGTDLRFVSSGLVTGGAGQGLSVRLRAYNTSGVNGANLYSEWSTPTLLVCAASSAESFNPVVESVTTGASYSLVEWRRPSVRQPDNSWAYVGGIHSYLIGTTAVLGGSSSIAQVALTTADATVTVAASTAADGSSPIGVSAPYSVAVPATVVPPTLSVVLVEDPRGFYAQITCNLTDYYSTTAITYTVMGTDTSNSNSTDTATGTSAVPGSSGSASVLTRVRFPTSGYLRAGHTYTFTATARHATGSPLAGLAGSAGVFTSTPSGFSGAVHPQANTLTGGLAAIYGSKWNSTKAWYDFLSGDAFSEADKVSATAWDSAPADLVARFSVPTKLGSVSINDTLGLAALMDSSNNLLIASSPAWSLSTPNNISTSGVTGVPDTTPSLSSTAGGTLTQLLAFAGVGSGGSSDQQLVVVADPAGAFSASQYFPAPTVPGFSVSSSVRYLHTAIGGLNNGQYLAALTTTGALHIFGMTVPVQGSTSVLFDAPLVFANMAPDMSANGSLDATYCRLAISADGATIVVFDAEDHVLRSVTRSGNTWTQATTLSAAYISRCPRTVWISADGTRALSTDFASGLNSGPTRTTLWMRSGATWTANTKLTVANSPATDDVSVYMTPDASTVLVYANTSNTFDVVQLS
jgi:hypothetical protein